jgi:hypothetical protein
MKIQQILFALLVFMFMAAMSSGMATADIDVSISAAPATENGDSSINPGDNAEVFGILDDFNRSDGPIGSDWTVQADVFNIVNNAAEGGSIALATYNGGASNAVEADVMINAPNVSQYTGLVLAYADISNNLFIKVQDNTSSGTFTHTACYKGNNGAGSPFGLGFFALDTPFTTAHMRVELSGTTVTITYSNIDGGTGVQTYTCDSAPDTGGNGIGISGWNNGRLDNFAAEGATPPWDFCVKDTSYITEYWLTVDSPDNILRGQALANTPSFPAPITGFWNSSINTASFSIGYLSDNTRHYWIDVSSMSGYTWHVRGDDSALSDLRAAQLVSCPTLNETIKGKTGDSE